MQVPVVCISETNLVQSTYFIHKKIPLLDEWFDIS